MTDSLPAMTNEEPPDAWTVRMTRTPMGQVPIDVLCFRDRSDPSDLAASSVVETLRRKGRLGTVIPVESDDGHDSLGIAVTDAMRQVSAPIFVVSDIRAEWNRDILDRLLKSIDFCDLAIGARPCRSYLQKTGRTLAAFFRGIFWGAGVLDPHTPYRMARSEPFKKFPLQSASRFVDVELIAKANFLDALIHEETLPVASYWERFPRSAIASADKRSLFRKPRFRFVDSRDESSIDEVIESSTDHLSSPEPPADVRTPGTDG